MHIIGFQYERSRFAREMTARRPGGMPDGPRLGVGRAGGMAEAGRLGARRGGGMVEAACLEVRRGGGMVEAACLEVRWGGGMGYVPHMCRPNLRMIVDVPHCLIIRPLRGRPKGRMPYAPTRTTTD